MKETATDEILADLTFVEAPPGPRRVEIRNPLPPAEWKETPLTRPSKRISRGAGLLLALLFSACLWWLIYRAAEAFIMPWVR